MSKISNLVSSNWDRAYNDGKYDQEGPIPFLGDIVRLLKREGLYKGVGFYPGCGNGRNLIPLLNEGLSVEANDISEVAIEQLKNRHKGVKVTTGDFLSADSSGPYDYLLSIQLFQHVNKHGTQPLFKKAAELLKPGGLFVLRVNSIHTQIVQDYSLRDTSKEGGLTIQYKTGQKEGQYIHFYSAEEIHRLTMSVFDIVLPLREEFIPRKDGTYWVQWETILKKR